MGNLRAAEILTRLAEMTATRADDIRKARETSSDKNAERRDLIRGRLNYVAECRSGFPGPVVANYSPTNRKKSLMSGRDIYNKQPSVGFRKVMV